MEFAFSEEQQELAATVRSLLTKRADSAAVRRAIESDAGYDEALWQTLCEQIGAAALGIPEEYDGAGFSLFESLIVLEEVGRSLAPSPLLSSLVTAEALLAGADEGAKRRLLPRIAAGEPAAFVSESGPVLDGDRATVLVAATDQGLVEVDPDTATRTWAESMDQTIRLAHVDLSTASTTPIGDPSAAVDRAELVGAVGVAALQAGLAARAVDMTVAYSKERVQFGRPIGSFQALKHRMADMLVLLEMSRSASWAASYAVSRSTDNAPELTHVAKSYCGDALARIAGETIQLHGGIAITWEHDAHLVFKRAHSLGQLYGSPYHHRNRLRLSTRAAGKTAHPFNPVTQLSYSGTITWMHEGNAELLRAVDPRALGARLRAARVARGLTQSALAGDGISTGYVSRIESGIRRPTLKVLTELARRLDKPVDQLLRGISSTEYDEIRLSLDYAELALENGEGQEAERHARDALTRAELASLEQLQSRGHYLLGRAYETSGRLDDAVRELEQAVASDSTVMAIRAGIAVTRCHRNLGDLTLAIEVGERIQATLPALGLDRTDEAVQLAMTVASSYIDRGDLGKAARLCTEVMRRAEEWASPAARSAAYWSASVALSERGQIQDAVALATRALALQGEGNDARNLARLRLSLGRLQLRLDSGAVPDALDHLSRARDELRWSSAGVVDLAQSGMALADAHLRSGDAEQALQMAAEVEAMEAPDALPERAEAAMIRGQAAWALQRTAEAMEAYQVAIELLTACGEDRYTAQLWYDLAELLDQVGMADHATTALRTAARASGLQSGRKLDVRQPNPADTSIVV